MEYFANFDKPFYFYFYMSFLSILIEGYKFQRHLYFCILNWNLEKAKKKEINFFFSLRPETYFKCVFL